MKRSLQICHNTDLILVITQVGYNQAQNDANRFVNRLKKSKWYSLSTPTEQKAPPEAACRHAQHRFPRSLWLTHLRQMVSHACTALHTARLQRRLPPSYRILQHSHPAIMVSLAPPARLHPPHRRSFDPFLPAPIPAAHLYQSSYLPWG